MDTPIEARNAAQTASAPIGFGVEAETRPSYTPIAKARSSSGPTAYEFAPRRT